MLGTFQHQVAAGGLITVTHPDVSRYFMTVEEAVALTIQAGAIGELGEELVLDMGGPVRILDAAQRPTESANRPVEIVFTSLRPGERLHEVLMGPDEQDERTEHPLISQIAVPPVRVDDAISASTRDDRLTVTANTLRAAARIALPSAEDIVARGIA